jgi:hypothetical protein
MMLKSVLSSAMFAMVQPGGTAFSVEPAADCAELPREQPCPDARWSSFYATWVRRESEATARKRFAFIFEVLDERARAALCIGPTGEATCEQTKAQRRWKLDELEAMAGGVMIAESGLREDVMVGRGWAKKASDDGGMGRGPGKEACVMQIHPSVTKPEPLLGADRESLSRCFDQGLAMLIHSRQWCAGQAPRTPWMWATVALYATGTSCVSANQGKTRVRVKYAEQVLALMRREAKR